MILLRDASLKRHFCRISSYNPGLSTPCFGGSRSIGKLTKSLSIFNNDKQQLLVLPPHPNIAPCYYYACLVSRF
eukprot:UN07537